MAEKKKTQTVVRDSRNGQFVKKEEAKKRPATTETEKIRRKK
jgi:hypothetical protein